MRIRGQKSAFSDPKYQVLVDDGTKESLKTEGSFVNALSVLRKNPKTWQAAGKSLEQVAEAISDEGRHVRRAFKMDELACLARLETGRERSELGSLTRLDGARLSSALASLAEKGMIRT